ncbi:MAG: TetM/TetW/TetO/TetS family tetracycline resistance ribosomal protection protein [Oscillospiraceae bacterium]|nr:TetM/TetW/TetO/TetS family tetracycline resistance ribosomal protection protein [Oscillospiraceae bacterium]
MNRVIGILAHVDAGKTTLSEAMLYLSGVRRKLGRVDHKDAFLDTDAQERERGITIFSKQAMLNLGKIGVTLMDTPGHVDFSAEMERTLSVLDCAVLVISGTDGVQSHTRTLWKLLQRHELPVFIFVNKMDLNGAERQSIMEQLKGQLGSGCVDFSSDNDDRDENIAVCDDAVMEEFFESGKVSDKKIAELISKRKVFPCWFGSALKLQGVEDFLTGLENYSTSPNYSDEFGARVFKVSRDSKNARLTWMKITGGTLKAKAVLSGGEGENRWEEKADQLRCYSGEKFTLTESANAGDIVAVTGLNYTKSGMALGVEKIHSTAVLEPVLHYRMILPQGVEPFVFLPKLRELEEEDPMLCIHWNEQHKELGVRLMGQVQLEVLQRLIQDRFGVEVQFDTGSIVYRETIDSTVVGMGHFEPLRHYAEVHLLMEPAPRGSGLVVNTNCSTDMLDINWQRLIFTHLLEKEYVGVLTGSYITDIKITLIAGRAHLKHTEGGDFRQAVYRAVRQGLMQAKNVLLEPYYDFRLELPCECVGRAMTDIQSMGGECDAPEVQGEYTVVAGRAPVSGMQNYHRDVAAYTRGLGRLSCSLRGYEPCHNAQEVIDSIGYDPEQDLENSADSVFCEHGSGTIVKWDKVKQYMHVDSGIKLEKDEIPEIHSIRTVQRGSGESLSDSQLLEIYERTYGKVDPQRYLPRNKPSPTVQMSEEFRQLDRPKAEKEYLLVDGYNIIFAWDDLNRLAQQDIGAARDLLEDILVNYRGFKKCEVILVFDAYKVKGNAGSIEKRNGIHIVYTKEAQTADNYIEQTSYEKGKNHRVRVATSDRLVQMIILGHSAFKVSAKNFRAEVEAAQAQISDLIDEYNRKNKGVWKIGESGKL